MDAFEAKCINTLRLLCADIVQKPNSGHPGLPLGMAPIAYVLWRKFLKFNPEKPKWVARDRFVLSNGHGSSLLYSMLHLTGYKVSLDDLKATPGHPESKETPGVEVTTGPLGQGIANAVGIAMAEKHLAAVFNKPNFLLFDNFVYAFAGDGCLQEGISHEAASLAGHLGLGKLIVLFDDNGISIDGSTSLACSDDPMKRFEAYGWHTQTVPGNFNLEGIESAVKAAREVTDKPSIIAVKTTIGFGAAKQGTAGVHGSPLGADDIARMKKEWGFDPTLSFNIPADVAAEFSKAGEAGKAIEEKWSAMFAAYCKEYPELGADLQRRIAKQFPKDWGKALPTATVNDKPDATRKSSGKVLKVLSEQFSDLFGGSADLTPSNVTLIDKDFQKNTPQSRYVRFGIREHGMAAICNGLSAYGCLVPFCATFLNFIEYAFPAVRLSAMSGERVLYVMTHDSIGLGEDGPTHQPIEALTLCRATPNVHTFRPADVNETSAAYYSAMMNVNGPSVIALTRQNVPNLPNSSIDNAVKGAYVVFDSADSKEKPDVVFVSTGSEVSIALAAAQSIKDLKTRVVSMPCWELFDSQPLAYREAILPKNCLVIAVEALAATGWERFSHLQIAMRTFGCSAPFEEIYVKFGFTPEAIAAKAVAVLQQNNNWGPLPIHFDF